MSAEKFEPQSGAQQRQYQLIENTEVVMALTPEEKELLENLPIKVDEQTVLDLKSLTRVIAGDLGVEVKLGQPGGGSYCDPERGQIVLDPLHIAENPAGARMVAAHEGCHRRFTRGPLTLGVKKDVIQELYGKQLGYAYISNAVEDPVVNNGAVRISSGLKPDFDATYDHMFEKENIPLGLDHPEVKNLIRRTGTIPNVVWVGSELIRYWHQQRFSTDLGKIRPEVAKILEQVSEPASRAFSELPEYMYDELGIIRSARERFRIVYEEIWPKLQPLIKEDLDNEAKRQMMQQQMAEEMKQKGASQMAEDLKKGQSGTPLDDLPPELREELAKAMEQAASAQAEADKQEAEQQAGEEKDLQQAGEELKKEKAELEAEKSAGKTPKEELKKKEEQLKVKEQIQAEKKKQLEQKKKEQGEEGKPEGEDEGEKQPDLPIDMNDLSDDLKKELKKAYAKLPAKERKELEEKARKQLEDLEDALTSEDEAKLGKDKPKSHKEFHDDEDRTDKKDKEQKRMEKAAKDIIEKGKTGYERIREEVDETIDRLFNELEEFFIAERQPKWRKGFESGPRLSLFKAMQFASGAKADAYRDMWERKDKPKRFDYRFWLVIDLSQSMQEGGKIQETRKGVVAISEVLERLTLPFGLIVFSGDIGVKVIKGCDQDFDDATKEKLVAALSRPDGSTPTASAVRKAYELIKEDAGKNNYVVTLTDGQPYPEGFGPTKRIVKEMLSDEEVSVRPVGVGLGEGTGFVADLFPSSVKDISAEELPETLGALFEEMITNPDAFGMDESDREEFLDRSKDDENE